jgi:hypothetical protein
MPGTSSLTQTYVLPPTVILLLPLLQAAAHQRQVESLQREFAAMLKDTLDKMHARLEQQHSSSMTAAHKGAAGSTAAATAAAAGAVPWKPAG